MRTKHVLMTTALMALFAACTNDEFISNEQGIQSGDAAMRPTVDVALNVLGDGAADTRLTYDGQYHFEDDKDVIGALLMDKLVGKTRPFDDLETWEEMPWLTRYELVDYINTDYPFTRKNGQWSTDAKMLEGNYFFAFPFASYDGYREAVHSIGEQVQHGQDINKAYAENQFFIGYSRIHAGTQGEEVMNASLELVPVLGTVGIQVKNVGTEDLTVKKIVLATEVDYSEPDNEGKGLSTLLKIDPTNAMYEGSIDGAENTAGYILDNSKLDDWADKTDQEYFNYANYEEMQNVNGEWQYIDKFNERYEVGGDLVNNTEKSANYNRREALRKVVKGVESSDQRAELTIENSPVLKPTEYANFAIMANIYEYDATAGNEIYAYIYTDRGLVNKVPLAGVNFEVDQTGGSGANNKGVTVISNNPLVKIDPNHKITIAFAVDNNSAQAPNNMKVYNEEDLAQLIEWNENNQRIYQATLMNNMTLTKEMSDMLTANGWSKTQMIITTGEKKLEIAADAAKNILDYVLVDGNVEVLGNVELGTNSFVNGEYDFSSIESATGLAKYTAKNQKLTIAEGASVTVSSAIEYKSTGAKKNQALVVAENEGTLTINANVAKLTITENKGVMDVNAGVALDGTSVNKPNAVINISATGNLNCGTTCYLTNKGKELARGEIEYAVINNNGKIYNLKNAEFGKVIVGEAKTIVTNVDENKGIIDITANIASELNKRDEGTISYTVAKDKSVTMANVAKYGITELIVDGGSVTSATVDDAADATAVTKVVVTNNGGVIGGDETSKFSNAEAVFEINGNVTLKNLTVATSKDIEVKNGTTTISGTVDASSAKVVLGSYEDYEVQTGKIFLQTSGDTLKAKGINKKGIMAVKKENAQVENNGKIVLEEAPKTTEFVTWGGNPYTPKDNIVYANATEEVSGSTALEALLEKDCTNLTTIVIMGNVDASKLSEKARNLLSGKNITLKANLSSINPEWNLAVKKLTVESAATIGSGNFASGVVMITVDELAVNAELTINKSNIKISTAQRKGEGCTKISGTNEFKGNGKVVAENQLSPKGAYLVWTKPEKGTQWTWQ